jgi:argininosuccinate lyase
MGGVDFLSAHCGLLGFGESSEIILEAKRGQHFKKVPCYAAIAGTEMERLLQRMSLLLGLSSIPSKCADSAASRRMVVGCYKLQVHGR